MAASVYYFISEEVENYIFRHNWILKHTCMYKKPALTKYWNYNLFVQILYSHFRYTNRLFLGCVFFIARCNIIRASRETKTESLCYKKNYTEEFVWHHFFNCTPSVLYVIFCCLLHLFSPLPKSSTWWIVPIKIHNIAMGGTLRDDIMNERSKL